MESIMKGASENLKYVPPKDPSCSTWRRQTGGQHYYRLASNARSSGHARVENHLADLLRAKVWSELGKVCKNEIAISIPRGERLTIREDDR